MYVTVPQGAPRIYVLGIDPSTGTTDKGNESAVGAAVVAFDADPAHRPGGPDTLPPLLVARGAWFGEATAPHADAHARTWQRVRSLSRAFSAFVAGLPCAVDLLAYENHTGQGFHTNRSLDFAISALLTVRPVDGLLPFKVAPNTAKAACGASKFKREEAKAICQEWALAAFGWDVALGLETPFEREAVADACAVAQAAFNAWRAEELKKRAKTAQRAMTLRKPAAPRKRAAAAAPAPERMAA